ncbi:MAG TPA: hypothetical protein VF960_15870, partial [Chloroflexota bacterium]
MSIGSVAGEMRNWNWPRVGLVVAGVLLVLALGVMGYRQLAGAGSQVAEKASAPAQTAVSVRSAVASSGPISSALSYSGDVKA